MKSALLPILVIAGSATSGVVSLASSTSDQAPSSSRFIRGVTASRGTSTSTSGPTGGLRGLKEKSTKHYNNNKPAKDKDNNSSHHRGYKPIKEDKVKGGEKESSSARTGNTAHYYDREPVGVNKDYTNSGYTEPEKSRTKDEKNKKQQDEKKKYNGKKTKQDSGRGKQVLSEAESFAREEHDKRVDHGRVVDDYSKVEKNQKEKAGERGGGKEKKEEKSQKQKAKRGGGGGKEKEKEEKNQKQKAEERGGGKEKQKEDKNQKQKAERDGGKEKSEKNERAKKEEERPSDLNSEPQPIEIDDEGQREASVVKPEKSREENGGEKKANKKQKEEERPSDLSNEPQPIEIDDEGEGDAEIVAKPEKSQEENGGEKKAGKKAKETERGGDNSKPEKAEKNKKADRGGGDEKPAKESKASDTAAKESAQVSTPGWEPTPMPVDHTGPAPVEPASPLDVNTPVPSVSPTEDSLLAPPAQDATEIPTNNTLVTPEPTEDTLVDSTPVASPAVTTVPAATSEDTTTVATTEAAESTVTTVSATEAAAAAPQALPSCPLRYNPQIMSYSAGDQTEMSDHIFTCQDIPYEPYCDIENMDPSWNATVMEWWFDAWALVGPCEVGGGGDNGEVGEDALLTTIAATEAAVQPAPEIESTTGSSTTSATTTTATTTPATTTTSTTELLTTTSTTELLTTIAATAAAVQPVPDTTSTATSTTTTTTSTTTTPAPSPGPTLSPTPEPTPEPTYAPTPTITTYSPTYLPTESPPECPEPYDDTPATNYEAGDQVEASQHIFACRGGEYEYYCNIPTWNANMLEENPNAEELWNGAWAYVGPCEISSVATFTSEGELGGAVDTLVVSTDGDEYGEEEEWYTLELSSSCKLKYQLNADEGSVSFEVVHMDGEAWVGLAFNSGDGKMVGSEAVIGIPLDNTVQKYDLGGKYSSAITPMPESQQTLTDASIEVVDGTTTLKFTKLLVEANEIEISTGHNTMLYAHGSHNGGFGYHGPEARRVFELTLSLEQGWGR